VPKIIVPEVLPASPLSLWCPFCGAKPGKDCSTSKGGFAVLHLARVAAAALTDKKALEARKNAKRAAPVANKAKK
jgi:hypothetical protein